MTAYKRQPPFKASHAPTIHYIRKHRQYSNLRYQRLDGACRAPNTKTGRAQRRLSPSSASLPLNPELGRNKRTAGKQIECKRLEDAL